MIDERSDPDALTGEVLAGRYVVAEAVARGGFATVYRARHRELGVAVAVKVLTAADRYAGEARARYLALFRQEAETLAALDHPAMVRVLDVGTVRAGDLERPWIAMEWLDGSTLEDDLRARGGVGRSPREVLELLRPAFDALACAHEAGVSHRDVKPANLMLVRPKRGAASLRVIDFGVAKVDPAEALAPSGSTATDAAVVAFSAPYAAPEQIARTRSGPWTDVHALGLVVIELLTGRRAYRAREGAALLEEILAAERPSARAAGVHVGPWDTVLDRALARAPDARPRNAAALWSELASSVEEAQAAWARSSRALAAPRDPGSADTLDEPSDPAPRPSVPRAPSVPPPVPAASSTPSLPVTRSPAWPWAVAAVALGVALFAARRPRATAAPPSSALSSAPAPPPVAPPSPPSSPAPVVAAPEAPAVAAPSRVAPRVPSRRAPRAARDAGARAAVSEEPRLVVE